ncbi:MAG: DUF6600 domain-containing protein [Betaproteobacteria bacterium]
MRNPTFFADRDLPLGLLAVAAFVVLAAPSAWADPPSRAGRLSYVTGNVSLAPAGLPDEWGEAFVNRPLTVGDRLWTENGSRTEIRVGSTAMRLDGGTSLDVLELDDRILQVSIDQGRAQVRTRGSTGGTAEIDTPAAAIVINAAADVRIDVDPASGRTSVLVRLGRANVYTPSESFDLSAGESTRIDGDGRYYTVGRAGPRDAFEQFTYTRDTRWREPRYVSAEMTGYEDLDAYGTWQPAPEYGNVWFPRTVSSDWAPYRDGRWVWVEPWGWSWVDAAPWGFAPFHYGRWVQVGSRWGWTPGERVARPVYAPALVAFFGGDNVGVSVNVGGGPIGWFPLGYRDPYYPWYETSPGYRRNVNVAYVRDPVVLNQVVNVTNVNITTVNNFRYAHRERSTAVTVVPRNVFVAAQPVRGSTVSVSPTQVASARMVVGAAPVAPERQSLVGKPGRGDRDRAPRSERNNKPVVAVNAPPAAPPRFEQRQAESARVQGKPFEVKPLAPRDDRTPDANQKPGAAPQAAPATASTNGARRDVRVIKPGSPESREARDRGASKGQTAQAPQPAGTTPAPQQPAAATPPAQAKPREAAPPTTALTAPQNGRERNRNRGKEGDETANAPDRARVNPPQAMTPQPPQALVPQPDRVAPSAGARPERREPPQAATPPVERRAAPQVPAQPPQAAVPAPQPQVATPSADLRAAVPEPRGSQGRDAPVARAQPAPIPPAVQAQPQPQAQQQAPRAQGKNPPQPQEQPQAQSKPAPKPEAKGRNKDSRDDDEREARGKPDRKERSGG